MTHDYPVQGQGVLSVSNLSHIKLHKLGIYASLAIAPMVLIGSVLKLDPLMAQSLLAQSGETTFTLPTRVDEGTTLKIDGSSSVATINSALEQQFENKFKGTQVDVAATGSDAALAALLEDKVDLVGLGRSLTAEEKAEGLVEVPLSRHKIAIIVSPENSFSQDLTIDQFAKIVRGEITDWSELGGTAGAIRFVDRPEISDTRQAFPNYPVFQEAPFETGATADPVSEDQTDAVVEALGKDGIGYAIVDQVADREDVKILSMHKVMPTDAKYPFSQPLTYVYKGPEPNPAVRAFLGYATAPENQALVESARAAGATAAAGADINADTNAETEAGTAPAGTGTVESTGEPNPEAATGSTDTTAESETDATGRNWWPWLLLPLLAGGLWWLLGRGAGPAAAPIAAGIDRSRLILTPRNCKTAYAYWELSDRDQQSLRDRQTMLRLYEERSNNGLAGSSPALIQQINCAAGNQDQHFNIPVDDRDYFVELGYEQDGQWTVLERSNSVRVPACSPETSGRDSFTEVRTTPGTAPSVTSRATAVKTAAMGTAAMGTAAIGNALGNRQTVGRETVGQGISAEQTAQNQIILVPRDGHNAYAYWEVSPTHKQSLRDMGGEHLKLRIHDVTNIDMDVQPPLGTQEYACDAYSQDKHVTLPDRDRDYLAELGYETVDGRWLRLARSLSVRNSPHSASV
jgi:phosphate transport system substrate-binding protein